MAWIEARGTAVEDGNVRADTRLFGTVVDTTQRQEAEARVSRLEHQLRAALENLIDNAVKFTEHGRVGFSVNAARGPVVNTDALVEALQSKRIRAALDVTDPEPLPVGHPLWKCPNLLITPHIAGSSPGMMDRVMRLIGDQCRRYLAGEPLAHVVTEGY